MSLKDRMMITIVIVEIALKKYQRKIYMSYVIIALGVMMIRVINYKIGEVNENYQELKYHN